MKWIIKCSRSLRATVTKQQSFPRHHSRLGFSGVQLIKLTFIEVFVSGFSFSYASLKFRNSRFIILTAINHGECYANTLDKVISHDNLCRQLSGDRMDIDYAGSSRISFVRMQHIPLIIRISMAYWVRFQRRSLKWLQMCFGCGSVVLICLWWNGVIHLYSLNFANQKGIDHLISSRFWRTPSKSFRIRQAMTG